MDLDPRTRIAHPISSAKRDSCVELNREKELSQSAVLVSDLAPLSARMGLSTIVNSCRFPKTNYRNEGRFHVIPITPWAV
jgi:hypothetical protein